MGKPGDPAAPQRSVNLSSIRRFRASASGLPPGSMGWNSPNPVAARRSGGSPEALARNRRIELKFTER